ncbi:sigma-54-dependent Fis family transcriptional regulator [Roseospira marina]|uniref:Sigma-54-dependent Fis family transcriptional regulator n=1 Tax=Roseospira marina TaxID=140057 RepID=A0A5M6IBV0_9PROT|nr:sigma-54 dependent transcriptional regulator [Roseospira marina]KAA5605723.1 sigma-54-dependent Fis family transcriptional regulator [Roseospira marina]MBB4313524.1 DNA-binding NtrC family response regulator [Roseospira marina]MBB5086686.1 DNA-binding NtrC family response regulator [Roseospira marina]
MRVLIVGAMEGQVGAAARIAVQRGAKVAQADDVAAALVSLRGGQGADLVMIDARFDVAGLIEALTTEHIVAPVVAYGIGSDTRVAVKAIKAGAKEFIPLPPDPDLIAAVLEAVAADRHALVFRDPAMARVVQMAEQVAPSDASVLVTGESGTGKELVARHLHRRSRRSDGPFIAVNCAAIPDGLLESELFGHEKGAFTGAVARRIGKFEEASGGTLLLDEISEMDVRLQAKLLRVIQEREIDRIGGKQPVKVNTRIVATSNRDLRAEVTAGRFREDLLFRLNVITLALPPLRQRPLDIDLLAEHFARKFADANQVPARPLATAARAALRAHSWPGNVRELENTLHRAVLLAVGDEIGPEAVFLDTDGAPLSAGAGAGGASQEAAALAGGGTAGLVGRTVADVERDLIIDTLRHCLGNRTHAATILGISIRTLRNKLRQYADEGVTVPAPGGNESPAVP